MQTPIPFPARESEAVAIAEGATWLRRTLSFDEQRALVKECHGIMAGPGGGYFPIVRGGARMSVRMVCLGRHWNALNYTYESIRTDHDNAPVAPVPEEWVTLASRLARQAGFEILPDVCILNWYGPDSRMGLHQDKDERRESIEAGLPVVSVSLGDTARFLFGGLRRRDPVEVVMLESGDGFVFGGAARLRYHGVTRILPGTAPPGLECDGRFNLTFRKY